MADVRVNLVGDASKLQQAGATAAKAIAQEFTTAEAKIRAEQAATTAAAAAQAKAQAAIAKKQAAEEVAAKKAALASATEETKKAAAAELQAARDVLAAKTAAAKAATQAAAESNRTAREASAATVAAARRDADEARKALDGALNNARQTVAGRRDNRGALARAPGAAPAGGDGEVAGLIKGELVVRALREVVAGVKALSAEMAKLRDKLSDKEQASSAELTTATNIFSTMGLGKQARNAAGALQTANFTGGNAARQEFLKGLQETNTADLSPDQVQAAIDAAATSKSGAEGDIGRLTGAGLNPQIAARVADRFRSRTRGRVGIDAATAKAIAGNGRFREGNLDSLDVFAVGLDNGKSLGDIQTAYGASMSDAEAAGRLGLGQEFATVLGSNATAGTAVDPFARVRADVETQINQGVIRGQVVGSPTLDRFRTDQNRQVNELANTQAGGLRLAGQAAANVTGGVVAAPLTELKGVEVRLPPEQLRALTPPQRVGNY